MTREEIRIQTIAQLERISGMLGSMGEEKDWTEYAIRALEQEPILDRIRAEIERLQKMCDKNDLNLMAQYSAFGMVLDILDKYKTESEDKQVGCIFDEPLKPYFCEADWNCKDCPNWRDENVKAIIEADKGDGGDDG